MSERKTKLKKLRPPGESGARPAPGRPTLETYVARKCPELYSVIEQVCMGAMLAADRPGGVTLLVPDRAAQEALGTLAAENSAEASRQIGALFIPRALRSGEAWLSGVVACLGRGGVGVKYTVRSGDGDKVVLAGAEASSFARSSSDSKRDRKTSDVPTDKSAPDVVLRLDRDFHALGISNQAVWVVDRGLPLTGEAYTHEIARAPAPGDKRPSPPVVSRARTRQAAAVALEAEVRSRLVTDRLKNGDPYLLKMVGLLQHLRAHHAALFQAIVALLDPTPLAVLYMLLEPHKTTKGHLLPDGVVAGDLGWNHVDGYDSPSDSGNLAATYRRFVDDIKYESPASAMRGWVDHARAELCAHPERDATPEKVQRLYAELAKKNTIGGRGPVFPRETRALLAAAGTDGARLLKWDEDRHTMSAAFERICGEPDTGTALDEWDSLVCSLRQVRPGDNYAAECALARDKPFSLNVAPGSDFHCFLKFINSTDFLFRAAAAADIGGASGSMHDLRDKSVYNRTAAARRTLDTRRGAGRSKPSLEALSEMRGYITATGQLPPDLARLLEPLSTAKPTDPPSGAGRASDKPDSKSPAPGKGAVSSRSSKAVSNGDHSGRKPIDLSAASSGHHPKPAADRAPDEQSDDDKGAR